MTCTPGPWKAIGYQIETVDGRTVACAYPRDDWNRAALKDAEGAANTRLIAAAPDLLAALKGLITETEWSPGYGAEHMGEGPALTAAKVVIIKVEGDSNA